MLNMFNLFHIKDNTGKEVCKKRKQFFLNFTKKSSRKGKSLNLYGNKKPGILSLRGAGYLS